MNVETKAGAITAAPYDDGMGKGIELLLNGETVCMLDVMEHSTEGGARLIVYANYEEDEPTHIIDINKDIMSTTEFRMKLTEAFKTHMCMKDRNYHTVNELLYILEYNKIFNTEDFNISIKTLDNNWLTIPCVDAFVNIQTRGIWFNDADVEFEIEECGNEKYNCITIYEREEKQNDHLRIC